MHKTYQEIKNEYNEAYKLSRKRKSKIYTIITSVLAVILFASMFLKSISEVFTIILYISLGILVVIVIIMLLDFNFSTNKQLFHILYQNIIDELNYNEGKNIDYTPMPKSKTDDLILEGGLFSNFSSKEFKYRMIYNTSENTTVKIYDAYVYTQSNNSRVVHFDGIYFVLSIPNRDYFQLRSNGSPKLKGSKFSKFDTEQGIKEYVLVDTEHRIDSKYYSLFRYVKEDIPKRKVYIGGVENEIHVAFNKYPMFRKLNDLTETEYNKLKQHIADLLSMGESFVNKITF